MVINLSDIKDISDKVPGGLKTLIKGYADYAAEVVLERAIPAIDGLKPSQRRILYTMKRNKNTNLTKSANVVGEVMKLHPHGDGAIYETLVHMVDEGQYMNVPYIAGKGNYGKVYFTEPAAASRYTECMLSPMASLMFGEMAGVEMLPSYDNKFTEPAILPAAFPSILANPTQGIAVGMASNIPAFNMIELNNATIELIETGKISKPLVPDYPTGAVYVRDDAELEKIMQKGKGRIKLRGKWHIEGKCIVIDEIPYYTNVDRIKNVMNEADCVYDVRDESDFNGLRLVIECRSQARVEEAVVIMLRDSSMQMNMTTNISVIINNKPRTLGVTELLNEWIKFRKKVLTKQYKNDLSIIRADIDKYELLVALLSDSAVLDKFIENIKISEDSAKKFLKQFKTAYTSSYDWIVGLSFKQISNFKSKVDKLNNLKEEERIIMYNIEHIEEVICRQLRDINAKYGKSRHTDIGTDDYVYNKAEKVKAAPTKCFVVVNGKFIKKCQLRSDAKAIECMTNDSILFIDNQARMLRLDLSEVEFYRGGVGDYLPVLLGIEDDFEVIDCRRESNVKSTYLYRDGYVSVLDWGSKLDSKKKYKIYSRAVPTYISYVMKYLPEEPYVLCITKNGKVGVFKNEFVAKGPTARTKIIGVDSDDYLVVACGMTLDNLLKVLPQFKNYFDRCKKLKKGEAFNQKLLKELLGNGSKNSSK